MIQQYIKTTFDNSCPFRLKAVSITNRDGSRVRVRAGAKISIIIYAKKFFFFFFNQHNLFKKIFFFFLSQNFKQKAPLSRFSSKDRESLRENVLSLGRPKQNAQPVMFDENHPIFGQGDFQLLKKSSKINEKIIQKKSSKINEKII